MATAKKEASVAELTEMLSRATLTVAGDHRGLTMADLRGLRRGVAAGNVEVHVVKNTLGRLAATAANRTAILELLEGPTALVLGFGDQVEAAKALTEYLRASRLAFPLRGAELDGKVLSTEALNSLALLPPRNVLLAQLLGTMQAPVTGLATVLNQVITGFVRVLDARAKQMEGA